MTKVILTSEQRTKKNELARKWRLNNLEKAKSYTKSWSSRNPDKTKHYYRKNNLKALGLTFEDYDRMYSDQDGCCKICGTHSTKLTYMLATDHCHKTGKVRGLLCSKCNTAIGLLNDDVELISKVIDYLKCH